MAKAYLWRVPAIWLLVSGLAWAQAETAPAAVESAPPDEAWFDEIVGGESGESGGSADASATPAASAEVAPAPSEPQASAKTGDDQLEVITLPTEPEAVPAQAKRPPPPGLEEIVVTATKREASVRELPASVSALRGEDLEKSGAQGQEDFLKLVPGVTFSSDTINANRITIRGIGADLNTSNTTGVFLGDVPFDDPTLPRVTLDPNPFDLARIEVLKGPQGTLFGGSALNGAVRYVPQEPVLGEWAGKTFAQMESVYEGDLGMTYGAAINVPFGETLALRLMGFDRRSPGWVDDLQREMDDVNGVNQRGGRLMGLWQPDDAWKISAMAVIQDTEVPDTALTDNREGRLSRSTTPAASPLHTKYDLETLGIQYSFDSFDILSQTSRAAKSLDGQVDASRIANLMDRPLPTVTITTDNQSESLMQELRFSSNDGFDSSWNWLGGAFYRKVHLTEVSNILASDQALPIPPALLEALARLIPGFHGIITEEGKLNLARAEAAPIDVTETALFGEATFTFWDDLDVTLGARAYRSISESRVIFSGALAINPTTINGLTQTTREGKLTEQGINPHVAIKYSFTPDISVYASAARGFRFGGAQILVGTLTSQSPDYYKSDTIWSYEVGLRTAWMDNTLTVDVTPFQIDWINPQLQQADPTGLGSYFDNVGGARGRGVELAVRYLTPLPGLALSFAGSYVDTVTTKPFTTSDGTDTQPGTRWPLAAEWQSATTLMYHRPLYAGWEGGATLLYATISSAPNTLAYLDTVFGYKTLDVTLNLGNPNMSSRPDLAVTLSNATDERGLVSGVNNPQFAKDHNYIRPRTLIARLSFSF